RLESRPKQLARRSGCAGSGGLGHVRCTAYPSSVTPMHDRRPWVPPQGWFSRRDKPVTGESQVNRQRVCPSPASRLRRGWIGTLDNIKSVWSLNSPRGLVGPVDRNRRDLRRVG